MALDTKITVKTARNVIQKRIDELCNDMTNLYSDDKDIVLKLCELKRLLKIDFAEYKFTDNDSKDS